MATERDGLVQAARDSEPGSIAEVNAWQRVRDWDALHADVRDLRKRMSAVCGPNSLAACLAHVPQHGTEDCRRCGRSLFEHKKHGA